MIQNVGMIYLLLKDRHVPKKAKLLIYMTILRPILLYGHEYRIQTKKLKSKITAADMIMLITLREYAIFAQAFLCRATFKIEPSF